MKRPEFFAVLKETLEIKDIELNEETNLLELIDSLSVISLMCLIDEKFGKRLSADELYNITNISRLIKIIGEEKFE
ncbi:MAG TPA: hypothetical protein DCY56_04630 [Candidatus Omnitrophica bacterium]|nr:hypothetical protein [Candidatus Omnitrophota bacterium]